MTASVVHRNLVLPVRSVCTVESAGCRPAAAAGGDGPVTSLVELSLAPVFRRGHGALYDALAGGAVDEDRMRDLLAGQLPADAPLMFGIDATTFPRPNPECSPDRGLHYAPCRCDGDRKVVPGWQFQWVMGLEWGSSWWTLG